MHNCFCLAIDLLKWKHSAEDRTSIDTKDSCVLLFNEKSFARLEFTKVRDNIHGGDGKRGRQHVKDFIIWCLLTIKTITNNNGYFMAPEMAEGGDISLATIDALTYSIE
ncbi:hypothetical protein DFQ30_005330 [Apophysomyces sp. BC1015]|nr:hypothetical protein DFQ30_005330 [Apophysomyces sp. BC1015]